MLAAQAAAQRGAQGRRVGRAAPCSRPPRPRRPRPRRKLSYKEQRELDELPGRIAALEAEQAAIAARLADGALFAKAPEQAAALQPAPRRHRRRTAGRAGAAGAAGRRLSAAGAEPGSVAGPALVGGRRVGAADDQPRLQVQRVQQPHRPLGADAGPAGDLAQVAGLAAQPGDAGGHRAGHVQPAQADAGRHPVGRLAGQLGQQRVARAAQRHGPQQRAQRGVQRRAGRRAWASALPGARQRAGCTSSTCSAVEVAGQHIGQRQRAVHQPVGREHAQHQRWLAGRGHGDGQRLGVAHAGGQHLQQLALRAAAGSKRSRSCSSDGLSELSAVWRRWARRAGAAGGRLSAASIGWVLGNMQEIGADQPGLSHSRAAQRLTRGHKRLPEACILGAGEVHAHQRAGPRRGQEQPARRHQPAVGGQPGGQRLGVDAGVHPAEQALRRRDEAAAAVLRQPHHAVARGVQLRHHPFGMAAQQALVQAPGHRPLQQRRAWSACPAACCRSAARPAPAPRPPRPPARSAPGSWRSR